MKNTYVPPRGPKDEINEINQWLYRKFLDNLIKHLDFITDPRPMTMDDLKLPTDEDKE